MDTLKIPYGLNDAGKIVHVDDVPRGKACGLHCPACNAALVARKGAIVVHHLAHQAGAPACEGWLHATAKHILFERIANAVESAESVPLKWDCGQCRQRKHTEDLIGAFDVATAQMEHWLADWNIRPDVVCFTGDAPAVIIEIVVSHAPESPVIDSGLPVFEIHVASVDDLRMLRDSEIAATAKHNYPCAALPCEKCNRPGYQGCAENLDEWPGYCIDAWKWHKGWFGRPRPVEAPLDPAPPESPPAPPLASPPDPAKQELLFPQSVWQSAQRNLW